MANTPHTCPTCGEAGSGITCGNVTASGIVANENQATCHNCGTEFFYDTGAPRKARKGTSVKGIERQVPGVHLKPEVVQGEDEIIAVAMEGARKRPVVAVNAKGETVVCCLRTARKHGWKVEGTLYGTAKPKEEKAPKAKTKREERAAKLDELERQKRLDTPINMAELLA